MQTINENIFECAWNWDDAANGRMSMANQPECSEMGAGKCDAAIRQHVLMSMIRIVLFNYPSGAN